MFSINELKQSMAMSYWKWFGIFPPHPTLSQRESNASQLSIKKYCHAHEGGHPVAESVLDTRLRGYDKSLN